MYAELAHGFNPDLDDGVAGDVGWRQGIDIGKARQSHAARDGGFIGGATSTITPSSEYSRRTQ